MTLAKRIIPALDVKDGQVVKGIQFLNLTTIGDPVEIAKAYQDQGADELVFLDITATFENRNIMTSVIQAVSKEVFIPLTVGGGLRTLDDIKAIFHAGADKIFLNSAAIQNPTLVQEAAQLFGNQAVVGAIDARFNAEKQFYEVYRVGGRQATGINALDWAEQLVSYGAGELLVTSMDADGTKNGYDITLYDLLTQRVNVPIIASGGAGKTDDFIDVFQQTNVDGALAASVFHYGEITIPELKTTLLKKEIPIRVK
ncbi:imidazole glycerol phosphate synthase subunit HisF [Leuconostoc fallax]|uniref:Imidazole glycerol phosphate synthase subunit HisF n=1 Tax=Leuconostoc fallax TaxID=1251 RepID=A0A4R5N6H8_9LACO|nr:imidazole glycerol phosphate synthase subunit HisF [Leuconostoc fallax]MBU7456366.1 imidazole glycerol phosphate synthase subunit HisF [Leuconostoc fallax]TDG67241.1 hypothetical protein C5L23_000195 [Leuconostoc fallax]